MLCPTIPMMQLDSAILLFCNTGFLLKILSLNSLSLFYFIKLNQNIVQLLSYKLSIIPTSWAVKLVDVVSTMIR